jgi:hypothetical protein
VRPSVDHRDDFLCLVFCTLALFEVALLEAAAEAAAAAEDDSPASPSPGPGPALIPPPMGRLENALGPPSTVKEFPPGPVSSPKTDAVGENVPAFATCSFLGCSWKLVGDPDRSGYRVLSRKAVQESDPALLLVW